MNIPKVYVEIGHDPVSSNVSAYIEIKEAASDRLMTYIKAVSRTCQGIRADYRAGDKIKYIIDSHLVQLANCGQLIKEADGTWSTVGFLWVDNEY